jgi:eukaryotic-like serine/threonine-protein kinase
MRIVQPGDEVAGRYRLEELQGHGPMSEVWRAHDKTLDRTVALKILSPTADLERFRREGRSLAGLAHENVMRVFDYGEDAAGPFMALEWLPGGTLEDRLTAGPLPPAETMRIAGGLAAGLAHLHSRGLVHRDLKPANVLFDVEDRPKLGDFGLARHALGSGTLTEAGTLLGTAAYISPEQASGEPAVPASDVYSFGVILFRMLTGSLPFVADDALRLIELHRHEPPPAVEQLNPEAPPSLAALTAATLRKDPAARPTDGAALLTALNLGPTPTELVPEAEQTRVIAQPEMRAGRSARLTTGVVLSLVFLAAAGGLVAWAVARPASTAPGEAPTGSVDGTRKSRSAGSTQFSLPTTSSTRTHHTQTGTTGTTSSRRTTTAATTAPATTTVQTTAPTTTAQTTTIGSTTVPTTTAPTTSTTAPATTTTAGTTPTQATTTSSAG